jgi:hypothetical protein
LQTAKLFATLSRRSCRSASRHSFDWWERGPIPL